MNSIDIINDIKEETGSKLTPAQICYELKKAAEGLSEDKVKLYQAEKPLSAEEKKEAVDAIGEILNKREADNGLTELIDNKKATSVENKSELTDEKEDSSTKIEDKKNNNDIILPPPTDNEVRTFVIPMIADKIIINGKDGEEPNIVTYDSDNFSAMLRLGDEEQTISLDRKDSENTNALVASKRSNQQEYQIIINNLKREEFEKFKALFEKATQKETSEKENNKGSELD